MSELCNLKYGYVLQVCRCLQIIREIKFFLERAFYYKRNILSRNHVSLEFSLGKSFIQRLCRPTDN